MFGVLDRGQSGAELVCAGVEVDFACKISQWSKG